MKILYLMALGCVSMINVSAQDLRFKSASVTDPMYEWSQYEDKEMTATLNKNNTLTLENKGTTFAALTYMELPVSLYDDDFVVTLMIGKTHISADKTFGVVFNYKNDKNYTLVEFDTKHATIIECERGVPAVVKRTIYKINKFDSSVIKSDLEYKRDKDNIAVTIERKNGKLSFSINGLYICSLKNYKIEYPTFGVMAIGKNRVDVFGLEYAKADSDDSEE